MREGRKTYNDNEYEYWLAGLFGLSGRKKIYLRDMFGGAEGLYRARQETIEKAVFLTEREKARIEEAKGRSLKELERELEYCRQKGIELTVWKDGAYPLCLETIYDPPYGLFYRGKFPDWEKKRMGVVGARNCTCYGKATAEQIGRGLAEAGVTVLSGMAAGIDGAAQRGALSAGGFSCGVLGCGVDVCYPAGNRKLYDMLTERGCVISEYPPHTKPLAANFPRRNRIISGLSDAVLVVEAREKSGSLITVDFALEQGKDIYAVPGRICDLSSQGTNRLIRQGAGIFLSVRDFLEEMRIFAQTEARPSQKPKISLENSERLVYSCLDLTPRGLEGLLRETGLSLGVLTGTLGALREKGLVSEIYKNYYIRSGIN